jgi:hypothetical protein
LRPIPRPARRVRRVGIAVTALLLPMTVLVRGGSPSWLAGAIAVVGFALSGRAVIELPVGRNTWRFSVPEAALGAALCIAPGVWLVPAAMLSVLSGAWLPGARRQPRFKIEYDLLASTASTAAAVLAVALLRGHIGWPGGAAIADQVTAGPLVAATVGAGAAWWVRHALGSTAVAFISRRPVLPLVAHGIPASFLQVAGNTAVGMLAVWLSVHAPVGLLGLLVPLVLLTSARSAQLRSVAEFRMYADLAYSARQAGDQSPDLFAEIVLTTAARAFGGADVELVLQSRQGPVRYAGDEHGAPRRRRVAADVFDQPWVMRLLTEQRVLRGTEDGRPYCAAVVGRRDAPVAVLVARRVAGSSAFGRPEGRLMQAFVNQAEPWLAGVQAAGDPAAHLGSAADGPSAGYDVLRQAAERLAKIAARPMGGQPLADVVEEVHELEAAVATLLGEAAMAGTPTVQTGGAAPVIPGQRADTGMQPDADGQAGEVRGSVPAQRKSAEWTTTGVMAPAVPLPGGES